MTRKIIFSLFALLIVSHSFSQVVTLETATKKAVKYFNQGLDMAMRQDYANALLEFEKAIAEEPGFIDALKGAGNASFELQLDSMAVVYYQQLITLKPDADVGVYKRMASSEQTLMRYEDAVEHIKIFLDHPKIVGVSRKEAEHLLASVQFAAEAVKNPVAFNPQNLGEQVNSQHAEYFPSLSVDNEVLVFTRKIPRDGYIREELGELELQEDFYISTNSADGWTLAKNVGSPVNTRLNEGAQALSADGRYLIYTLCNHPLGFGSCDLYYALRIGDTWTEPQNCGRNINTGDWESQPSLSADGRYLFFSSKRPGGMGGYDIWVAEKNEKGFWNKPVNAGPAINTAYDEQCPYMHPDGKTLYFSSNGHPGFGGKDLFFIKKDVIGNWQKPVNLGYPINTGNEEITLSVSADGKTAYFASDKANGFGGQDIYQFTLAENLRPDPVTYVKATVRDEKTQLPLKATIQLMDISTGDTLITSMSDEQSGEFIIPLPIGKKYALFVNKEGYLFHSENFSLEHAVPDIPFNIDINLQEIRLGEIVTLKNIFFETASAELLPESKTELLKVKELLNRNPDLKIRLNGHTDHVGSDDENMKLSVARAESVKNFLTQQGIDSKRITTAGFGETKPLASNETEEGKALNRRTEMEIIGI